MHREYHRWWSPALHRDMELLAFGHAGATLLALPTSRARFHEWEDRGLIHALSHRINAGHLRVVCVDTVDAESWYAWHKHPGERAWRQAQYNHYIVSEVVPFTRNRGGNPFITITGASLGAFHALSIGLRHPYYFGRILAMSALCDIGMFTAGYSDETVHTINPGGFIPHEHDPHRLDALRKLDIILAVGNGDRFVHQNRALSGALWQKGVGNALREWDGFAHDWPVWVEMLNSYVDGHD